MSEVVLVFTIGRCLPINPSLVLLEGLSELTTVGETTYNYGGFDSLVNSTPENGTDDPTKSRPRATLPTTNSQVIAETYASLDTDETDRPKVWCYDVCYHPGTESEDVWVPIYCFSTMEFLPQDYKMMSWFISTHQRSFFTRMLMCTRMVMDADGENIVGNITLVDKKVQRTTSAKLKLVKECTTENERVHVLHKRLVSI